MEANRSERAVLARAAAATALVLVVTACTPAGDPRAQTGAEHNDQVSTSGPGVDESGDPVPGDPVPVDVAQVLTEPQLQDHTIWVLDHLEPGSTGPPLDDLGERFAPGFLEAVPAWQLGPVFLQLRAAGPYVVTRALQAQDGGPAATLWLHADEPLVMSISLDEQGRIAGLLFQPDTAGEAPELDSLADLDAALTELGGQTQVVVAQVDGAACTVTHTTAGLPEGGEPAPVGSAIKLLVLAGLVDAIEAGDLAWDSELTVTEEFKSLPSGVLQDREAGSTVSVTEAAELMISISDNTATDLLIERVGQDQLATSAQRAGLDVGPGSRLLPVASTRQFFQLGWMVDQDLRQWWEQASTRAERAAVLSDLPAGLDVDPTTMGPVWEQGVDWFLSGAELCRLHARLQQQAADGPAGAPVRDILAANPGLTPAPGTTYQGFKGGSAPGVLTFSFYLETGAGGGTVLVVQTRSDQEVDLMRAATIVEAGLQHLVGAGD